MAGDEVTEVTVSPADLQYVVFDGSVIIVTGTAGNTRVIFAGDARPMWSLLFDIAESGREQTVEVEAWQIVRVQPMAREAGAMRSLRLVERDISEAEAMVANADKIGPTFDNDSHLISTAEDRVASYVRRLARLQQERAALLRILGREGEL